MRKVQILLGAGVVALALVASSGAAGASSSGGAATGARHALAGSGHGLGNYNLTYCWEGVPCGSTTWSLAAHHQFTSGDGNSGTWNYKRKIHKLTVTYATGCDPIYTGTGTPKAGFSGTMTCPSGSGTWSAAKS